MSEAYTSARVKEELPQVEIRINGKTLKATTHGRLLRFATVRDIDGRTYEFAWATIVHSLNTHTPLIG